MLGHLDRLVSRSLVHTVQQDGRTWYGLLETLRAYARARLVDSGEFRAVTDRCVDWTSAQSVLVREQSLRLMVRGAGGHH